MAKGYGVGRSPYPCSLIQDITTVDDLIYRKQMTATLAGLCGPETEVVVGIAPSTIVWACWVGEALSLPIAYLREVKAYGRRRSIEGGATTGKNVVLITDGQDVTAYLPVLQAKSVFILVVP